LKGNDAGLPATWRLCDNFESYDPLHRLWIPGETFQPPDLPTTIQLDPNTVALVDAPLLGLITYEVLNANELLAWGTLTVAGAVGRVAQAFDLAGTINTMGAPLLRFLQGRVRCCRYHEMGPLPLMLPGTQFTSSTPVRVGPWYPFFAEGGLQGLQRRD